MGGTSAGCCVDTTLDQGESGETANLEERVSSEKNANEKTCPEGPNRPHVPSFFWSRKRNSTQHRGAGKGLINQKRIGQNTLGGI